MKNIILPNLLMNSVYVRGLEQSLNTVADVLDAQDKPEFALSLRYAAQICEVFADVNLDKTAKIVSN